MNSKGFQLMAHICVGWGRCWRIFVIIAFSVVHAHSFVNEGADRNRPMPSMSKRLLLCNVGQHWRWPAVATSAANSEKPAIAWWEIRTRRQRTCHGDTSGWRSGPAYVACPYQGLYRIMTWPLLRSTSSAAIKPCAQVPSSTIIQVMSAK